MKPAVIFHQYIWIINKLKAFDIRPTADFLGQLLSHGAGIEVLEPLELRQKMRGLIEESLKRY